MALTRGRKLPGIHSVAPVAPVCLVVLFVDDINEATERLALRQAEAGANLILAEPFDPVVYERAREQDEITYAAPSRGRE